MNKITIVVEASYKVSTGHQKHGTGRPGYRSDKRQRRSTRKSRDQRAIREYS